MYKVSVITVVKNNISFIEDCIESVIGQTYAALEYIIVDGGSTDGTKEKIKNYERKIAKWISEPDKGIYDAMNKGIKLASGDIIGILNSDDFYHDNAVLDNVASVMSHDDVDACYSDLVYIDHHDPSKVVRYWRSCHYVPGLFKKSWVPAHPTFFVKRKIYEQYGMFDLSYKLAADFELMARFIEKYRIRVVYIPKILVKMRTGGATNKSIKNILLQNYEIFQACRKNDIKVSPLSLLMRKCMTRFQQYYLKPSHDH